jgi:NAD(P)-dependent dehydrogenase (short-subunit alcohol dehydrogenase family)
MSSLFSLDGKTAVITGSSRGIGRAIAERMTEAGARVVISSRKEDACVAVADELNALRPGSAIAQPANISSKDDLRRLVEAAQQAFGGVDILVCNAASNPHYGPMSEITDDQFRKVLENNIISNNWLAQMVAPGMQGRGDGAIVIISSIGGFRGSTAIGAYNISKAADFQLARNLAVELGPHGIRVNCIAPGLIKTDFARALWENDKTRTYVVRNTPLGRIGEPDDIAGAAIFLASPAGRFITGQTIVIDGGLTISAAGV